MTALTVEDLRGKYSLFNTGDVDKVVAQFHPEAEYRQTDTGQVAVGHDQIRTVMESWRHFFGDSPQIEDITIRQAHGLAADVPGAVQCFVVDFKGVGVYQNTIPGLEQAAPARGREVRLPIGETVWIDASGLFLRVDTAMQITALQ